MGLRIINRSHLFGKGIIVALFLSFFIFYTPSAYAQVDSRNQAQQTGESQFELPDISKKKRLRRKRDPRIEGKKIYPNKKQLKANRKKIRRNTRRIYSNTEQIENVRSKQRISGFNIFSNASKIRDVRSSRRISGFNVYSNRKQLNKNPRIRSKRVEQSYRGNMYKSGFELRERTSRFVREAPDPYKSRPVRTEKMRVGQPIKPIRSISRSSEQARRRVVSGDRRVKQGQIRTASRRGEQVGRKLSRRR